MIRVTKRVEVVANVQQSPAILVIGSIEDLAMLSRHCRQPFVARHGIARGSQFSSKRFCYGATHSKCDCARRELSKKSSALRKSCFCHLCISGWVGIT